MDFRLPTVVRVLGVVPGTACQSRGSWNATCRESRVRIGSDYLVSTCLSTGLRADPLFCTEEVYYTAHRLQVISADSLRLSRETRIASAKLVALSIFLSPGFLIIDHMHFQYNGAMYGLLLYSIIYLRQSPITAAFIFASLLCFKHIYLYLAPAYFIYLLRTVVLRDDLRGIKIVSTIRLGLAVVFPIVVAFAPFIYLGQMPQVLSRLFPFNRGLCHAYWAPNFWALYSFVDRIAIKGTNDRKFYTCNTNIFSRTTFASAFEIRSYWQCDARIGRGHILCIFAGNQS